MVTPKKPKHLLKPGPTIKADGRPAAAYSKELFEEIIQLIDSGMSVRTIEKMDRMPDHTTLNDWVRRNLDGLAPKYREAMERDKTFDQDQADAIIERLREGESLAKICRDSDMPKYGIPQRWATNDPDGFGRRMSQAREQGYLKMFDEIIDIMDTPRFDLPMTTVSGGMTTTVTKEALDFRRLQIDTRKWALGKALPKIFGQNKDEDKDNKVQVEGGLPE